MKSGAIGARFTSLSCRPYAISLRGKAVCFMVGAAPVSQPGAAAAPRPLVRFGDCVTPRATRIATWAAGWGRSASLKRVTGRVVPPFGFVARRAHLSGWSAFVSHGAAFREGARRPNVRDR